MGYINPVVGIHFPGLQVYTCTLFTPCTAVPIQQIKEVREGLAKGSSPKERCFSIIYTEGKKSKTLDLVAHDPADAEAWVQGLMFLLNKDGRSCDQQCCLDCHVQSPIRLVARSVELLSFFFWNCMHEI